jgi:hypothetical protein
MLLITCSSKESKELILLFVIQIHKPQQFSTQIKFWCKPNKDLVQEQTLVGQQSAIESIADIEKC